MSSGNNDGQITFEELGIQRTESTQQNVIFGKARTLQSITREEYVFFVIVTIGIFASFAFTLYRLVAIASSDSVSKVFAILLLINLLFCFVYLVDGIFREQQYEILVLVCTTAIVLFYIILDYFTPGTSTSYVKLVRLIISAILGPVTIAMGLKVAYDYWISGNLVFRIVGGSTELQAMCKLLYLGFTLLVFDAQAMISSLLLILEEGLQPPSTLHLIIIIVGMLFTLIWLIIGYLAMRLEDKILTFVFMCLSIVQPLYVFWKFYETTRCVEKDSILYPAAFLAGIILLVIHSILVAITFCIYKNFGNGLKEKVYGESSGNIPSSLSREEDQEGEEADLCD